MPLIFQLVCTTISLNLNALLIYLILNKSPKQLGIYKYLMLYISISEVINTTVDLIIDPIIHSHYAAFVILRDIKDSIFDRNLGYIFTCVYCGMFGFSISIFGVHFIYRYGTVDRKFWDKYLSGKKVWGLFVIPLIYGTAWLINCILCYRQDEESDDFMREEIKSVYNLEIEYTSYLAVIFHHVDKNGISHPKYATFAAIGFLLYIVATSMFSMFYFGIKCYCNIHLSLKENVFVSKGTRSLQRQLFRALVIQTLIPMVLMFIPVGLLFVAPMFNYQLSFNVNFVTYTVALYPAIDPLPNLLLIQNYRLAMLNIISCGLFSKSIKVHVIRSSSDQNTIRVTSKT